MQAQPSLPASRNIQISELFSFPHLPPCYFALAHRRALLQLPALNHLTTSQLIHHHEPHVVTRLFVVLAGVACTTQIWWEGREGGGGFEHIKSEPICMARVCYCVAQGFAMSASTCVCKRHA